MTGFEWSFIAILAIVAAWDVISDWVNRKDK